MWDEAKWRKWDEAQKASGTRKTAWAAVFLSLVSLGFQLVTVGFLEFVCVAGENSTDHAKAVCADWESGWFAAALAIPPLTILFGGLVAAARDRRAILYWTFVVVAITGVAATLIAFQAA